MSHKNTFAEYSLTCPYCQDEIDPGDCEIRNASAGEQITIHCYNCENKFKASYEYVFNSNADCKLNGEEHVYELDDSMNFLNKNNYTYFKCINCGNEYGERKDARNP